MKLAGWNFVDENASILWRSYHFTKDAQATTLVFRGTDGLVVVSPATGLESRDYDALKEVGEVRALIANNSFHHMGQADWRKRFPNAESYCPPGSIERLAKKAPGIPFKSLSELKLPPTVHWEDPPGFKTGEALLSVKGSNGYVWFTGDLLTNIEKAPGVFGMMMKWLDAAPGFKLFKPGVWMFVKDKKVVREWTLDRLTKEPPTVVVTAHGPPVDSADVAELAKKQLERL
ncbi:MAG: MBL fold metallo-hydrolase [Polyangiaceae bacterium]|nr:MBL fold metallo-hydrolase [Polyangiaceae bacterium]